MTVAAWIVAGVSFFSYAIALVVGASCANTAGPYCAAAFFASFVWLAYRYDRKGQR